MSDLTIYSDEELRQIQQLELDGLRVITNICERLHIKCFLCGGSALGAIRHGGFIPWDDDIDVGLVRADYLLFLEKAPALLPAGYELQTPYNEHHNPYYYTKLRIDGTKFIEYCNRRVNMHHGVYVDIFPFDEIPDDETENLRQFQRVQRMIRLFTLRQTPDVSTAPQNPRERVKAAVRRLLHYAAKAVPRRLLIDRLEREITRYNGTNQSRYTCLNYPKRNEDAVTREEFFPLRPCLFAGMNAYVFHDCEAYLTTHFGNYMQLPPPEQRFGHKPYHVELQRENA